MDIDDPSNPIDRDAHDSGAYAENDFLGFQFRRSNPFAYRNSELGKMADPYGSSESCQIPNPQRSAR